MLDLTKYEGHTPGPWILRWSGSIWGLWNGYGAKGATLVLGISDDGYLASDADGVLITDSPLLLAEVSVCYEELERALEVLKGLQRNKNLNITYGRCAYCGGDDQCESDCLLAVQITAIEKLLEKK